MPGLNFSIWVKRQDGCCTSKIDDACYENFISKIYIFIFLSMASMSEIWADILICIKTIKE